MFGPRFSAFQRVFDNETLPIVEYGSLVGMPSRRTLARRLESVADFDDPIIEREQYLTPPDIAAHVCHFAALRGDFTDQVLIDLGTGTGMLAIGAGHFDADRVIGIDVDRDALAVAQRNARVIGEGAIDWVCGCVSHLPIAITGATVISNPPFGARRESRNADRAFLEAAERIATVSYTFHNAGSRSFVESFAFDLGGTVTHAFEATFDIDHRFEFHERERQQLDAEVFRIEWSESDEVGAN